MARILGTSSRARLVALLGAAALTALIASTPTLARRADATAVSASISYTDGSKSKVPVWKNIKITIKRNDAVVVDGQLLPEPARESVFAAPKLLAVDLDDDGEAEVIVDVFTAGVDCCRRSAIYHHTGDTYDADVVDWPDSGYRLDDVIGQSSPEFLATDSRFPRAYDSDARGPLRVLAFSKGKLRDVSRQAPHQLIRDARIHNRAWRAIRRKKEGDARPVVAAYVADLVRLGKIADAKAALQNASDADELRSSRKAFTKSLDRKLVAWGYSKHYVLSRH